MIDVISYWGAGEDVNIFVKETRYHKPPRELSMTLEEAKILYEKLGEIIDEVDELNWEASKYNEP